MLSWSLTYAKTSLFHICPNLSFRINVSVHSLHPMEFRNHYENPINPLFNLKISIFLPIIIVMPQNTV
jgi:hypothetical protein